MAEFSAEEIASIVEGQILQGSSNIMINNFSTNSKEGDSHTLFVPIIGERVDAHDYIKDAYQHGITATFTGRDNVEDDTHDMTYIKVESPVVALQHLGATYRKRFQTPMIGVTGSVGKTTTKEMIAAALSTKYHILKTLGNKNSQVGLPQMMMMLDDKHQVAVIEMGMSKAGEMERLAAVAMPTMAVITNIGVSHIGQLKSKENIRKEKAAIVNQFNKGSILLVNGDDPLLLELAEAYHGEDHQGGNDSRATIDLYKETQEKLNDTTICTFGTSKKHTIWADQIEVKDGKTIFTVHYKDLSGSYYSEQVELSVLGQHNVLNALVALFFAIQMKIPVSLAKEGLKEYQPLSMRGDAIHVNGLTLIDDTYNASPDSMKGAIEVVMALPKNHKKIIVFADILELGEISAHCHYEVGEYLVNKTIEAKQKGMYHATVDLVITIGSEAAHIIEGINAHPTEIETIAFTKREDAIPYVMSQVTKGDTILLKGSRGMQLEEIVKKLKEG